MTFDVQLLKQEAAGQWKEILTDLGSVSAEILDGKHHPCPKCRGKDRFRMIDAEAGAVLCNQCFKHDNGDGIAALQWLCGWTFPETVDAVADYLGRSADRPTQPIGNGKSRIVATYDYCDEHGELLYQAVRLEPKGFRQRRPKPGGGWEWKIKGTRLVPYRLQELLAADPAGYVFVVEGEKDGDRAASIGLVATTCAMGAGKWRPEYNEHFQGRNLVIIPDNDRPGREHADQVARSLNGVAASIKVVELPGAPEKGDLSDWLNQGHTRDDLEMLVGAAPVWQSPPNGQQPESSAESKEERKRKRAKSQATALVKLTMEHGCELWRTPENEGFVTVPVNNHKENWKIKSQSFRRWLQREYFNRRKKAVSSQAIQDAIGVLEGQALYGGPECAVNIRVAELDGKVFIDLCDPDWRVIEVDAQGWRVLTQCPVRFRRSRSMQALPVPVPGDIAELCSHLGLTGDSLALLIAWMAFALRPGGPFPVLNFNAEQGAGKTTITRKIRRLIDPNAAPVRCEPKEPRDLMIAANNGWIIALDNLSHIPPWLSDALCRMSTGGGFSTRALYSDDDEVIFDAKRPIIITGIEELATRGDLLERGLIITLPNIREDERRPESEIWREFDEAQPRLLAALLDVVSAGLRNEANTQLADLPRMADFARFGAALETAIGLEQGDFMRAYNRNAALTHDLALEASPVARAVQDFVERVGNWYGTATDLLAELDGPVDHRTAQLRAWPKTARNLSSALRRLAPNLRAVGIEVEFCRTKHGRSIHLRRMAETSVTNVTSVTDPDNSWNTDREAVAPMTQEMAVNVANDAGDAEIQASSDCPHHNVQETPTFDGYLNRECRDCGQPLPCRPDDQTF